MTPPTSPETADIETIAGRLEALADRCEAATGPDRELDALIATSQGLRIVEECHPLGRCCYDDTHRLTAIPRYTASLDAAMTLAPVNGSMQFAEFSWSWEPSKPEVWPAASVRWYPPHKSGPDWHAFVVSARTPALTLCAAALHARAAHLRSGDPQ